METPVTRALQSLHDHDQVPIRPADLDTANLDEVHYRVVAPVMAAMFLPGELERCAVHRRPTDDGKDRVAVTLRVRGVRYDDDVVGVTFERESAEYCAYVLADRLTEFIAESSFGWGQLREATDELAQSIPAHRHPVDRRGRPMLEVYAAEDHLWPLWRLGLPVPAAELRLSDGLTAGLLDWHALLVTLGGDEGDALTWDEFLDVLEPARYELVDRLRRELGSTHEVAQPLPMRAP